MQVEQAAALVDHHQQAATAVVILLVGLKCSVSSLMRAVSRVGDLALPAKLVSLSPRLCSLMILLGNRWTWFSAQ